MFEVYFENKNEEQKFLAECDSFNEAMKAITNFLEDHNFKHYYSRMWIIKPGCLKIDVGSHIEFFYVISDIESISNVMNEIKGEENEQV